MESSIENPIAYFTDLLACPNSLAQAVEEVSSFFPGYVSIVGTEIIWREQNNNGEWIENSISFFHALEARLKSEFNNSKRFIRKGAAGHWERPVKKARSIIGEVQYLLRTKKVLFEQAPGFLLPLKGLVNYVDDLVLIPNREEPLSKFIFNETSEVQRPSLFHLKPHVSTKKLSKVFRFLKNEEFIDPEIYDFDDFIEILTYKKSHKTLEFKVSTKVIVEFIDLLSKLFFDFDIKIAEENRIFKTKSTTNKVGTILTALNFYSTKSRNKSKPSKEFLKISALFEDL